MTRFVFFISRHRCPAAARSASLSSAGDDTIVLFKKCLAALVAAVAVGTGTFAASAQTTTMYTPYWGKIAGWTTPTRIDVTRELESISCPSMWFCFAVDSEGHALTFITNNDTWSGPQKIDPAGLASISCPPIINDAHPTFCVAVGVLGIVTYIDGIWGAPAEQPVMLDRVSCATSTFCVAVGEMGFHGDAMIYSGGSWQPISIEKKSSRAELTSVSCVSAAFCAAVDTGGRAAIYSGGAWNSPTRIDRYRGSHLALLSVSCAATTFCVAVDEIGRALTFDGTSWGRPVPMKIVRAGGPASISCPAPHICDVVYNDGELLALGGNATSPTWSDLGMLDSEGFAPSGSTLSCPTITFCAAVDADGAYVYHPRPGPLPNPPAQR